jgi:ribonuclease H2 subunit A
MDPLFGWGNVCRFSWATAKELLEGKNAEVKVEWPVEDDDDGMKLTDYFSTRAEEADEMLEWFGKRVTDEMKVF